MNGSRAKQHKDKQAEQTGHPESANAFGFVGPQASLLALQRAAGNSAVSELIHHNQELNTGESGLPQQLPAPVSAGNGQPLESQTRNYMERLFGQDFSKVRVHSDSQAEESASKENAKAYTLGNSIVFGRGRYAPQTGDGNRLIAHELAHVVQQSRGGGNAGLAESNRLEAAAEQVATKATSGSPGTVTVAGAAAPSIMRQPDPELEQKGPGRCIQCHRPLPAPKQPSSFDVDFEGPKQIHVVEVSVEEAVIGPWTTRAFSQADVINEYDTEITEPDPSAGYNFDTYIMNTSTGQRIAAQHLGGTRFRVLMGSQECPGCHFGHGLEVDLQGQSFVLVLAGQGLQSLGGLRLRGSPKVRATAPRIPPRPTSKPNVPAPKPNVPAPAPKPNVPAPAPKPNVPAPAPKPNVPAPAPKPNVPAPAPKPNVPAPAPKPNVPARKQPAAQSAGKRETVEEYLARGGIVKKIEPQPTPKPEITAAPKQKPDPRAGLGEGPEVNAVKETTGKKAGVRTPAPARGQDRPPLPSGPQAPRGEINRFKEPFRDQQLLKEQKEILELAKTNPQEAGRRYENLLARDIKGGEQVQNKFRREGRRMDIGTEHEVTIEGFKGELGKGKLDQLWDDLVDKGNVTLSVPKLSDQAKDQLARLLAQAREKMGPNVIIVVRETLP